MMSVHHLLSEHHHDGNRCFPCKAQVHFQNDPFTGRVRENMKPGSGIPGICTAYIACSNY